MFNFKLKAILHHAPFSLWIIKDAYHNLKPILCCHSANAIAKQRIWANKTIRVNLTLTSSTAGKPPRNESPPSSWSIFVFNRKCLLSIVLFSKKIKNIYRHLLFGLRACKHVFSIAHAVLRSLHTSIRWQKKKLENKT